MHSPNGRPLSPALKTAARMPLLDHYRCGERFDITKSQVVRWLCGQPELQQELFNFCKRQGAIIYVDGKWIGSDTYGELKE